MPNFTSKILGNSLSAIVAQQALIANASNNIANVNTPGYTRRDIALLTRGDANGAQASLVFGSGVELGTIRRITNRFLETAVQDAASRQGMANVANDYLGRIENLFSLSGPQPTIGSTLNDFFSAVNTVAVNPSSLDDRLVLMQKGEDLVSAIKSTYNAIATTQTELDYQVSLEVDQINDCIKQIGSLNELIWKRQSSNIPSVDEQDQRDALMNTLAEKITFQSLELENGMMNISLANGFPLVSGTTVRPLGITTTPSFGGATLPPSLEGRTLSYIVYNFGTDASPAHIDLTKTIKGGMGSLGGILKLRGHAEVSNTTAFQADGELVAIAQRIESLTRALLTDVNQTYFGSDEDSASTGMQSSAGDINGSPPDVFGLFDFDYSGVKDADGDGVASAADLLASGMTHFSTYLTFAIKSPDRFAAARDNDTTEGITAFPMGDGRNAVALASLKQEVRTFTTTGGFTLTGTFDELYSSTVNYVGSIKSRAETDVAVGKAAQASAQQKRDELSAVSLDEEFANLIRYQKAFQASARLIKTVGDILDQVVALI
jgi:flagellar hook-associated protein 1 FlgK